MATYTGINFDNTVVFNDWFIQKALMYSVPKTVLYDWINRETLPVGKNADAVKWVRRVAPASSNVVTLTEGTTMDISSTSTTFSLTAISGSLTQQGVSVAMSDLVTAESGYNLVNMAQKLLGESAALQNDDSIAAEASFDSTTRDKYPRNLTTKTFAGLLGDTTTAAMIDSFDLLDAVTALRASNGLPFAGKGFACVMAPEIIRNIVVDQGWRWPAVYNNAEKIYNAEIGKIHGCTVLESTNVRRENTENTHAAAGSVYSTLIFGQDAIGGVDFASQPFRPKMYTITGADKFDIYNQTEGFSMKWKWGDETLNGDWVINLRSKALPNALFT